MTALFRRLSLNPFFAVTKLSLTKHFRKKTTTTATTTMTMITITTLRTKTTTTTTIKVFVVCLK